MQERSTHTSLSKKTIATVFKEYLHVFINNEKLLYTIIYIYMNVPTLLAVTKNNNKRYV